MSVDRERVSSLIGGRVTDIDDRCAGPEERPTALGTRSDSSHSLLSGGSPKVVRTLRSVRKGHRKCHLFLVSVIAYMRPETRDEERLARCPVCTVTRQGFAGLCQRSCSGQTEPIGQEYKPNDGDRRLG